MKWVRLITVIVIGSLLINACTPGTFNLQGKTPAPGDILFEDDFSRVPGGWGTMARDGGEISFNYGGIIFEVKLPDFIFWSVNGKQFTDTTIEVDAIQLEGPANDSFGAICRYHDDQNFYGFILTHDGYYGIFKMIEGRMVTATVDGNLGFSDSIRQGGYVNHLQAECIGNTLRLSVNNTLLAEVVDKSFSSGQVGLLAGAYDTPGVMVLFDNLKVTQP